MVSPLSETSLQVWFLEPDTVVTLNMQLCAIEAGCSDIRKKPVVL
jgi:hypothetical protein